MFDLRLRASRPAHDLSSWTQWRTSSPLATGMRSFASLRMTWAGLEARAPARF